MPHRLNDIVVFLSGAPVIAIQAGVAHVRDNCGGMRIERALSVKDMAKCCERMQRALERHAAGDEIIIVDD